MSGKNDGYTKDQADLALAGWIEKIPNPKIQTAIVYADVVPIGQLDPTTRKGRWRIRIFIETPKPKRLPARPPELARKIAFKENTRAINVEHPMIGVVRSNSE